MTAHKSGDPTTLNRLYGRQSGHKLRAGQQELVDRLLPQMRGVATGIFFLGTALIGLGLVPFAAGAVSEASGSLATGVKATLIAAPVGLACLLIAIRAAPAAMARKMELSSR